MTDDEDLGRYSPGGGRRGQPVVTTTPEGGIVVTARLNGDTPTQAAPTRYALSLRRQATNRVRAARGETPLPSLNPGSCARCEGWGVVGAKRGRCPDCGGSGDA